MAQVVADERVELDGLKDSDKKQLSIEFVLEAEGRAQVVELSSHTTIQSVVQTVATAFNVDRNSIALPELDDGTLLFARTFCSVHVIVARFVSL